MRAVDFCSPTTSPENQFVPSSHHTKKSHWDFGGGGAEERAKQGHTIITRGSPWTVIDYFKAMIFEGESVFTVNISHSN